jgi:hypothetical protein
MPNYVPNIAQAYQHGFPALQAATYIPHAVHTALGGNRGPEFAGEAKTLWDKVRQTYSGGRAQALYDKILGMADGPEKQELINQIAREDLDIQTLRHGIAPAIATVGGELLNQGQRVLIEKLQNKVVDSALGSHLTEEEKKLDKDQQKIIEQERRGQLARFAGSSKHTDKITLQDAMRAAMGAQAGSWAAGRLAPGAVERLVGAERFWHGTKAPYGEQILRTGIDPGFGGREGGAAWAMTERQRLADELAEHAKNPLGMNASHVQDLERRFMKTGPSHNQQLAFKQLWETTTNGKRPTADVINDVRGVIQPGLDLEGMRQLHGQDVLHEGTHALTRALMGEGGDKDTTIRERFGNIFDKEVVPMMDKGLGIKVLSGDPKPDLPIEAHGFQERATGRSFITTDRAAASNYARVVNPEMASAAAQAAGVDLDQNKLKSIAERFEAFSKNKNWDTARGAFQAGREGLGVMGDMLGAATGLGHQLHDKPTLVAGVAPHDVLRRHFEADPDNVFQAGTAMRSSHPVVPYGPGGAPAVPPHFSLRPEQLAQNDVSLRQIFENRATDMGKYIRGEEGNRLLGLNKRFLSGAARGAGALGILGGAVALGASPIIQKLRGTHFSQVNRPKEEDPGFAGDTAPPLAAPTMF